MLHNCVIELSIFMVNEVNFYISENHSNPLRNVQSAAVLSRNSTAVADPDVAHRASKTGNDGISDVSFASMDYGQRRSKLNRSNTDADASSRNLNRFRTRLTTEQANNSLTTSSYDEKTKGTAAGELFGNRSRSPKDSRNGKFLSSCLNKAKEGLKSVTSSFGGTAENSKTRQSRSAATKSSRYRSSSVGANVHLSTKFDAQSSHNYCNAEIGAVSPRTQLKNARQNLKKVSSTDENKTSAPAKQHGKTFVIVPKQNIDENANKNRLLSHDTANLGPGNALASQKTPGRPLAIIDNTVSSNRSHYSSNSEKIIKPKQENQVAFQQHAPRKKEKKHTG